ncbi:DEAD/DEAH box helicase family protein [Halegenticoccus tardaugens]|uniref:DEAD/DEAH box helicase family protein n=1 Tax=Halegenticoccus tardaugens TaxID=2071624 RepID=UPI00100B2DF5|nr:DEAD/DEAH box helicase family protein [Halegenticoccus tardaugens]
MTDDGRRPPDDRTADDHVADGSDEENAATSGEAGSGTPSTALTLDSFYDAVEAEGRPVLTAQQVARRLGRSHAVATEALERFAREGSVERVDVETDPVVWYPKEWNEIADRERVILFSERREIVVDRPTQYTRAQLSQFAHLVDSSGTPGAGTRTNGAGGYLYRIRREDIWASPFDDLGGLLASVRAVLPRRSPHLEAWIEDQWKRANQFVLYTHDDGYTVLKAASESLMGNVARQKLGPEHLHAPISDAESWAVDGSEAAIKRVLYGAGYPVRDERDLDAGDPLDVDLRVELRDYQRDWVERFLERKSGVLVGPPGAGKTVAGLGVLAAVGGETLILVPSRQLAGQWREELLANTTLEPDQVGEYHGGQKEIRPVTVATYQTAGMDRHRSLFDSRRWGLVVLDEAHHIPAPVFRRAADLQSKHRLGLSATPVRESDDEEDIFTLIGPPIGTDWSKLFEAGFVQEPEVEIQYVPWRDETARNEFLSADGRERHRLAAENPAKADEARGILADHPDAKALVFVEYLDQGRALSEALGIPFISGEMRHARRGRLFEEFRRGDRRTLIVSRVGDEGIDLPNAELAVVASGLGGSRRQGSQRAGRTMRPSGSALVYVLATYGTIEEDFAQRQMRHLAEKGVRVRERTADEEQITDDDPPAIDDENTDEGA